MPLFNLMVLFMDAFYSIGTRWSPSAKHSHKAAVAIDLVKVALLSSAGCYLKVAFPKIGFFSSLAALGAAGYHLTHQELSKPDRYISSVCKTSFLLGSFLLGIGLGSTYRGIMFMREGVQFKNLHPLLTGFHRAAWSVSCTIPLSLWFMSIPKSLSVHGEKIDKMRPSLQGAIDCWRAIKNDWNAKAAPLAIEDNAASEQSSKVQKLVNSYFKAIAGGFYLWDAVKQLAPADQQKKSEADLGADWIEPLSICFGLKLMKIVEKFAKEKVTDESAQKIAAFCSGILSKSPQLKTVIGPYLAKVTTPQQAYALLEGFPELGLQWLANQIPLFAQEVKKDLTQAKSLSLELQQLHADCLSKLSNIDAQPQMTEKAIKDLTAACHSLTTKTRELNVLLAKLRIKKEDTEETGRIIENFDNDETNQLFQDVEAFVQKDWTLELVRTSVEQRTDWMAAFSLPPGQLRKLESLRTKSNGNSEEKPDDDFTEAMGSSWKTKDYDELAQLLKVPMAKLDAELTKRGLNTRKELLEKKILLTVDEKNKLNSDDAVKAEEKKRLFDLLKCEKSSSLVGRVALTSLEMASIAGFAFFAPRCFGVGLGLGILSKWNWAQLTAQTPADERFSAEWQKKASTSPREQLFSASLITLDNYIADKIPGFYVFQALGVGYKAATKAVSIGNELYLWKTGN